MVDSSVNSRRDYSQGLAALQEIFGDRACVDINICANHGHGEGYIQSMPPDMVIFVNSTEEISQIITICNQYIIPVIAFGVGTSLEGHVNAVDGGVTIDLSQMNEILQVNPQDMDCRLQAGVTREQLNHDLRTTGLFFPIDPGANATIGGMAATRASGTNAVRYGTMRENILGLTVVCADGKVIRTGGRAKKSAAGYDLTRLFIGSEGTLGIISEIQLKLHPIPMAISSAVCQYPDLKSAVDTAIAIIQSAIPIARIELLDDVQMKASIQYSKLEGYMEKPTLFFEFHGSDNSVKEQSEMVGELSNEFGGNDFKWSANSEDRNKLRQARHNAYYAGKSLSPNRDCIATDICVPISNLAECLVETKKDIEQTGLIAPIVGHVGDGNFHLLILVDKGQGEEFKCAKSLINRMNMRAISFGGTCTGEHGVGIGKKHFMAHEHGDAMYIMRLIKKSLDPKNIMNPKKIFDM